MTDRGAFTVKEAAHWLGISERHLYTLMDTGDVPYVMLGSARRIARRVLERLLDPVVTDLRDIAVEDVADLLVGLRLHIAQTVDASHRARLVRLEGLLVERVAYAEALAAPVRGVAS